MEMLNTLDVDIDKDVLLNLYDNSIIKLIHQYMDASEKFSDLYKYQTFNIYVNDWALTVVPEKTKILENCRKMLLSNTKSIVIKYHFLDLKNSKTAFSSFSSRLEIEFSETSFSLIDASESVVLTKPLSELLNETEIQNLIDSEMKRHQKFLKDNK